MYPCYSIFFTYRTIYSQNKIIYSVYIHIKKLKNVIEKKINNLLHCIIIILIKTFFDIIMKCNNYDWTKYL